MPFEGKFGTHLAGRFEQEYRMRQLLSSSLAAEWTAQPRLFRNGDRPDQRRGAPAAGSAGEARHRVLRAVDASEPRPHI